MKIRIISIIFALAISPLTGAAQYYYIQNIQLTRGQVQQFYNLAKTKYGVIGNKLYRAEGSNMKRIEATVKDLASKNVYLLWDSDQGEYIALKSKTSLSANTAMDFMGYKVGDFSYITVLLAENTVPLYCDVTMTFQQFFTYAQRGSIPVPESLVPKVVPENKPLVKSIGFRRRL